MSAAAPHIAYVQSGWHEDIVDQARAGFLEVAEPVATVETFEVPGALELPLHAKLLAGLGRFDAIVAAGFIVDGGIYRHEFVSQAVLSGLMDVQLESGVPVLSAVLTPQRFHEHEDHHAFFFGHMRTKGREVATAALQTIEARALVTNGG